MKKKDEMVKWVLHDLADLSEFSEEFRSYCEKMDLDDSKIFELELSLEELIVNAFTHGYEDKEQGTVIVEAEDAGTDVRISLHDHAPPFDLFRDAPAPRLGGEDPEPEAGPELPATEPEPETGEVMAEENKDKVGGLGIHLVKNLNDKVEYYGSKDGNIIIIIKAKA